VASEVRAALIAVLLVFVAAGVGLAVGTRARPAPTPRPVPSATTIALPAATPVDPAEVQRRAFAQPLSSGCATDKAVWLFADGGAAIRYDGRTWTIPDPTLRSIEAAACREGTALAVGGGGSLLTADEDRHELRADRTGLEDLHAVALLPDGAIAVGAAGTVLRQSALDWTSVGAGISEDLYGVAASPPAVWLVGMAGVAYRLTSAGWTIVPTPKTATLRAVAIQPPDIAIAAGDRGTVWRWTGTAWAEVRTDTSVTFRAAAVVGAATWIVGDGGTVLELLGERVRRIEVGTGCTLRAVFPQGSAVWIVGSDGTRGGAWRITATGTDRWGAC
jgi:hypothetical protein